MAHTATLNGSQAGIGARPKLIIGALGVVYGDIGTSPLYTMKQCFDSLGSLNPAAVYGVLSLISWALFVVVTLKYVLIIMRADNRGEGGILALTALARRAAIPRGEESFSRRTRRLRRRLLVAGLLGASLFYGDSLITPAISVLSAVEGLKVATPLFAPYVLPITIGLLIGLFLLQHRGTALVGGLFGPIMAVWFLVLALLGVVAIARHPTILLALSPTYGLSLLAADPWRGFILLGAVVLAVTGAEALYADMGHFGRVPIRAAWLSIVFPALLLNYFGQGALLLVTPEALENPFYRLAPDWALYPMVILAATATVIASQAVISGAFSMTRQAVQLGYLPRLVVRHTSVEEAGQVYVPRVNRLLFLGVIGIVLGFQTSDNLGAAYGIAVTGTMTITSLLAAFYMTSAGFWTPLRSIVVFGGFLVVDLAFFSANLTKLVEGGWFPLAVGAAMYAVMATWMRGRNAVFEQREESSLPLAAFLDRLRPGHPIRVPGTAIFMTGDVTRAPLAMLHNLKHNHVLHERIVLMTIKTEDIPRVPESERVELRELAHNVHTVTARYGFMDQPSVPRVLARCRQQHFHVNLMETSFFLLRQKLVASPRPRHILWRKRLFIFLSNSMLDATEFFHIPSNRVIEVGEQIEI